MKFVILAIDHGWQMKPYGRETPEVEAAKQAFRAVMTRLVGVAMVDLICEESDPSHLSLAQEFAYSQDPRIPWKNIIMSAQERLEAGVYDPLLHRESHVVEEPPGSGYFRAVDHRIPEDDVREQFFSRESIQAGVAHHANTVLVLCGDMHADALQLKLETEGHGAIANHDLIPRRYWQ
jgi:hypothetical protein